MEGNQTLELIGKMRAPFRFALGEGLVLAVVGMRQVIGTGEQGPNHLRLATMPPALMPPKPTP